MYLLHFGYKELILTDLPVCCIRSSRFVFSSVFFFLCTIISFSSPLRADKKLERVKQAAPVHVPEAMGDDAAGFKKPLRFRCISCDKPLGLKQRGAQPALPEEGMFPDTQSFRPYTTYELELIRRHQRMYVLSCCLFSSTVHLQFLLLYM